MLNVAKVQYKLRVASGLNLLWRGSMEWNMEENCKWNGIWKKNLVWNGRKLPVWNMEKSSSILYHAVAVPASSSGDVEN